MGTYEEKYMRAVQRENMNSRVVATSELSTRLAILQFLIKGTTNKTIRKQQKANKTTCQQHKRV